MECKIMELCQGRHDTPARDGAIFENIVDVRDITSMSETVEKKLEGIDALMLYVTGLTVALVEVINYCHENKVELVLMHYDKEKEDYYPQIVH